MNDSRKIEDSHSDKVRAGKGKSSSPFQSAVLRGLGVVLPPLLTVILLLWIWNSVQSYVLIPVKNLARSVAVSQSRDVLPTLPEEADETAFRRDIDGRVMEIEYRNKAYHRLPSNEWIPSDVYHSVRRHNLAELPMTGEAYYRYYVSEWLFRPALVVPFAFLVFVLLLYLLGKIIAARLGKLLWASIEKVIDRVPLINMIYGTVKQVTDIVFGDNEMEFSRVVAVEYPRRGTWSVGFVTGESLPAIATAASEPVLSVLMPTSPMPATGFTISVRKSETVDLSISIDQAFQFIVSCGVVIPGIANEIGEATEMDRNIADAVASSRSVVTRPSD